MITRKPHAVDIEKETKANDNYRKVGWTGRYLQVTYMTIPVGETIGLEVHKNTDQFLRVEAGKGVCRMGKAKSKLDFEQTVEDDWAVMVPAGTWHDIENTGDEPLKLYAIYAPVHHAPGTVHATKEESEADEEAGRDEPPAWTVQPD